MNNHYTEVFNDLIDRYKTLISIEGLDVEIYKWKFVKANLGKPDLNADDFVQEIKLITKTNLVYNLSAAVLIDLS